MCLTVHFKVLSTNNKTTLYQLKDFQKQHDKIKKILKVDYPLNRTKEYYANFISAKKLKVEFSLFHPSGSLSTAISPKSQGRVYGTPRQNPEELFD